MFPVASTPEQFAAITGQREVGGASAWLVWHYDYEQSYVVAAFATREAADGYVAERTEDDSLGVEEVPLHAHPVPRVTRYHFGADVFPDGQTRLWDGSSQVDAPGGALDPGPHRALGGVRDHPWSGHTQGHCGFHASVFGCDREQVEAERDRQVAIYREMADGSCDCGRTGPYQLGWGWGGEQTGWIRDDGTTRPPPEWERLEEISRPCEKTDGGWKTAGSASCTGCGTEGTSGRVHLFSMERWGLGMRWMALCDACASPYGNLCMSCLVPREGNGCPKCHSFVARSISFSGDS